LPSEKEAMGWFVTTMLSFSALQAVNGPASSSVLYQEPTIYTTPEHLVPLCYFLRDHVNTQFKCLIDITAVDFPEREQRFEVVYHLLSPKLNSRLRIKVGWCHAKLYKRQTPPWHCLFHRTACVVSGMSLHRSQSTR
jgi:NADH:ubiquinone oxidoreductase subunit C